LCYPKRGHSPARPDGSTEPWNLLENWIGRSLPTDLPRLANQLQTPLLSSSTIPEMPARSFDVLCPHSRQQGSECAIRVRTGGVGSRGAPAEGIIGSPRSLCVHSRSRRRYRAAAPEIGSGQAQRKLALLSHRAL